MMEEETTNTIKLNDYELNLIHGLLVDEEKRMGNYSKIKKEDIDSNSSNYVKQVKLLRQRFTKLDKTEDYFEVFGRLY